MNILKLNTVLLLLLVATLLGAWALPNNPGRRNFEFLPGMVRTAAYDAFAPNPAFADGMTLRTPVAGTIARGSLPLHYQSAPADAIRAGEELKSPYVPAQSNDPADVLERGANVYRVYCQPCHGSRATGDGAVVRRGYPAPPSLLADRARTMKDGQMFHVLTYGQGNMPAYADQVSREDRWKVISYIRSLQGPPQAATTSAAPAQR